jgi:hypothetical protein
MPSRRERTKRPPNAGRFAPGDDPRRHAFTQEERRRGYQAALAKCKSVSIDRYAWFYYRVRGWYRAKKREETTHECASELPGRAGPRPG